MESLEKVFDRNRRLVPITKTMDIVLEGTAAIVKRNAQELYDFLDCVPRDAEVVFDRGEIRASFMRPETNEEIRKRMTDVVKEIAPQDVDALRIAGVV